MTRADQPRHGDYIRRTYSGRKFHLFDARPEDVHIEDIAHALALCNRFAGHTTRPYSVAQHSVMMARTFAPGSPERKWALLHDAAEAYIGDMVRPLKRHDDMEPFRALEQRLLAVICERFGLPIDLVLAAVDEADQAMLRSEQRDLVRGSEDWRNEKCLYHQGAVQPWPWWEAEAMFLIEFESLWPDFDFEPPETPNTILQVSGDDLLRLLQENAVLRAFRDEAHRRESARVEASRSAVPVDQLQVLAHARATVTPYDPAEEWDEVDREIKRARG
jgi:hypothetical protein